MNPPDPFTFRAQYAGTFAAKGDPTAGKRVGVYSRVGRGSAQ